MTWLTGWNRRRPKTIRGNGQVDYQMKLNVHKSSGSDIGTNVYLGTNIKDDFSDIRFTLSDGVTILSHFIESFTPGIDATVCIKIDSIPPYPATKDIYIYYDNPVATDVSDPAIFRFYKDWKDPNFQEWTDIQCGILNNLSTRIIDRKLRIQFSSDLLQPYVGRNAKRLISPIGAIADPSAIEFTLELDNLVSGPMQEHSVILAISANSTDIYNDLDGNCAQGSYHPLYFALNLYENSTYGFKAFRDNSELTFSPPITPTSNKSIWRIELLLNETRIYVDGILVHTANQSFRIPGAYIYLEMYSSTDALRYVEFEYIRIYQLTDPAPTWETSGTEQIYTLITATSIVPDKTICTTPCNVNVDITWTNAGQAAGTFAPSIRIDGNLITPAPYPSETLASGASITHTFSISGLTTASHQICADPDSGTSCTTITVLTPANIVTTAITPNVTTCTEPCNITVDITWTNNGQTVGTFAPTMTFNGTSTILAPENLNFGQSITKRFSITGLAAGTYNICSDPNTFPCVTVNVTVPTPANIFATNIVPTPTICIGSCNISVDVTYANIGETEGTFIPEIKVDDTPITLISDTLGPGADVIKAFSITNMPVGTHTICAVPLGTTICQTITVERVVTTGIGDVGILIVAGTGLAVLYSLYQQNKMKRLKR